MAKSPVRRSRDIRILIVDDDYIYTQQIRDVVVQTGFSVAGEAQTGDEAVQLTLSLQPDLVLMDIKMSPINGIEAARRIQQLCPRPVVLLSAYQNQQFIDDASRTGVMAYLKKPLTRHDLARTLPLAQARFDELLGLRHTTHQLSTELAALKQRQPHADRDGFEEAVERQVRERTQALEQVNAALQRDIDSYADIQNRLAAEREEAMNMFLEANLNANIVVDAQGLIVLFNPAAEELFGYTHDEVQQCPIQILLRESAGELHQGRLEGFLSKGIGRCGHVGQRVEFVFRRKDGTLFDAEMSMAGGRSNGHRFLVASIHDITERKQIREQLNAALEAKQALIREAYHRTKNNMGTIINLLKLQSARIDDDRITQVCQAIERRIHAMLLVQQRLYRNDDVRFIELKDYCEELAYTIVANICADPGQIDLKLDLEPVWVLTDTAIVCGSVLNELMTNALKYAFPQQHSAASITIRLHALNDGSIELRFSDNGIGLPADFDLSTTETLGLQLVRLFIRQQLRGKLDIVNESGTEFVIVLPAHLNTTHLAAPKNSREHRVGPP